MSELPRRLGLPTATLTVVANMIGTGVFTTTGVLLDQLGSPRWVLGAWLGGGLIALFGAFAYGELGARSGKNGGEYRFLTDIIHPSLGFVTAWISLAVGFSAPIAASAIAFGEYASAIVPGVSATAAACALVVGLSILHAVRVGAGAQLQNVFTAGKVLLIAGFIVGALVVRGPEVLSPSPAPERGEGFGIGPFAVALILVSFAYSGWNGAAYLAGEVKNPGRSLPIALVAGTLVVLALYVGLNAVFLGAVPGSALSGEVEVGHVVAVAVFGDAAGRVLSGLISLALVSSVSAMIMVGPRVYEAVGEDFPRLSWLAARRGKTGPVVSTALQGALALVMVVTATFETLLVYIGLTLSLSAALAVACVFVDRRRNPDAPRPYRAFGHPITSGLFIAFMLLTVGWSVTEQPAAALASGLTIALGFALYTAVRTPK
jgi:APA family basic amino acid/polyamine antiporter